MMEVIYVAIAIIAANVAFTLGYMAYILPETEKSVKERKQFLGQKLNMKIQEDVVGQPFETVLVNALGGILTIVTEEHRIKNWETAFSRVKSNGLISLTLAGVGIVADFLMTETNWNANNNIPFSWAFVIAAVLYFFATMYQSLQHREELHRWRMSLK